MSATALPSEAEPAAPNLWPLFGKVVDADGAPALGATAHCVLSDPTAERS